MAEEKQKIQVQVQESVRRGVYSNAVSVAVRDSEVVLDFGYVLPGVTPTTIDVGSRVNLNHKTAEQLVTILQNALLDYRNKKKEKK
ncbi:MAG: DUF3467 domain-containing protein [Candidatus Gracilibacteria bacterium]|nr:DUF3467 domain-containing protein [Candidatus Gracilibacteria bacterium]